LRQFISNLLRPLRIDIGYGNAKIVTGKSSRHGGAKAAAGTSQQYHRRGGPG
jgi:hypothetical protein